MSEEINPTDEELVDEPLQQKIMEMVSKQIEGITDQLKASQEENEALKNKCNRIELQKKIKDAGLKDPRWLDVLYFESDNLFDSRVEIIAEIIQKEKENYFIEKFKEFTYIPGQNEEASNSNSTFNNFVKNGGK
ncbi:TPA: hypothetical protein KOS98_003801 [Clostridioides difficile]|uniref:hypothetical protein n=1 Tax=Clostridioides difficile TaxID=1496 RepID=UPI00097FE164|nr:hypothetical protein [Clostridioides difficile]MDV9712527.1 hypothetical protein [Clostridioides difficile]SJT87930.1 Uncharacterised protein [Clostridioides difficile]HBF6471978.1 hypothetical protein [Clostridioides difficile]